MTLLTEDQIEKVKKEIALETEWMIVRPTFMSALLSDRDELMKRLEVAMDALTSIASKHRPRHSEGEFWLGVGIDACAETLSTDTRIAREAIAKIESMK